jgi:ubiquinone/menaquinone biosynthesis C-methylase UbiE
MGSQVAVAAEAGPDRFWDTYSRYYDCVYMLMPYRKLLWDAFEALDLEPGMRVLDAGCGTGNFEHFIAEKNHPSVAIDAVDFSPEMLKRAGTKLGGLDYVRFTQADLNGTLPFADATFDRVVSINVLYALEDWDHTMGELLRVLKPEGRMVLTSSTNEFSSGPILADHIRRIGNIWGTKRKARAVLDTVRAVATTGVGSMALNTFVINRRESKGRYYSPDHDALRAFLRGHEPNGVEDFSVGLSMADQNFLATATKACAGIAS